VVNCRDMSFTPHQRRIPGLADLAIYEDLIDPFGQCPGKKSAEEPLFVVVCLVRCHLSSSIP
jgi:hypothetical protein